MEAASSDIYGSIPLVSTPYRFADREVNVLVPDREIVKRLYIDGKLSSVPFWTGIWPSSRALCTYLASRQDLFIDRQVVELGAGLGLPSFFVAHKAKSVFASDIEPAAVRVMQQTATASGYANMHFAVLDWANFGVPERDTLILLSDVNYDPSVFGTLRHLIDRCLEADCSILIGSPQRLMAKSFLGSVAAAIVNSGEVMIEEGEREVPVSVMLLQQPGCGLIG